VVGQLDRSTPLHPDRDLDESRDILPSPFAHVFHPKALVLVLMQWLPIFSGKYHSATSILLMSLVICCRSSDLADDDVGWQQRLHRPRLRLKKR